MYTSLLITATSKSSHLLKSVYQFLIAAVYQFTSAGDTVPLAEIAGYGFALDTAFLTAPDPAGAGAAKAVRAALADAQIQGIPSYINVHGTGTKQNDSMECAALRKVFGGDVGNMPISSTKPLTGHLCGAAGVTEVICSILSLLESFVPPTLGLRHPDLRFKGFDFVMDEVRKHCVESVMSMNSGFGGTNSAILMKTVES